MLNSVVSFSGGMDSATLLWQVTEGGRVPGVLAVNFTYGSKHNRHEREAARKFADRLAVPYREVDLTAVMAGFRSDLMKTGGAVPEGHYEEKSMERTVVPARNIIFASVLAGIAWSEGAENVYLGVHAGDHMIYPDCRPEFIDDMYDALMSGTDKRVKLRAPFVRLTKRDILVRGLATNVPYELTRTCYVDNPISCGKCGSCIERREAFMSLNAEDPVPYEYTGPLPEKPN